MATEVRVYSLDIPAGTLSTAPVSLALGMPPRVVDAVQVIVPPGPAGGMGWRIQYSGVTVVPYDSDAWVITSDEIITWPLEHQPTAGDWTVQGYNEGVNAHTVYFRFLVRPAVAPPVLTSPMIDDTQLLPQSSQPSYTEGA